MPRQMSHAVVARRFESLDSLDDFPTPPFATRGFISQVIAPGRDLAVQSVLEPACGRGYISRVLGEFFGEIVSFDVFPYGYAMQRDFLAEPRLPDDSEDWVITNPPFRLAEAFIAEALRIARVGVAVIVRSSFTEGSTRYRDLFLPTPPTMICQCVERVPMFKARCSPEGSTATSYTWLVWEKDRPALAHPEFRWIAPCRAAMIRPGDYLPDYPTILLDLLR